MARGFYYTLTLADQFSQTFEKWDQGLQTAVRNADQTAARMDRSAGRVIAGFGAALVAAVPAMGASFIPLENALARLETVTTTTTGTMEEAMSRALVQAREWSSQHVQSTTEIIQAEIELATAGLNAEQSLAGVAVAAKMATATGDDLSESAQLLASLFNTFGQVGAMKGADPTEVFEKMGDSLAETIKRFQVQIVPLRQGLSYITGQATVLGLSLNEVNTALGILNTAGIRASQAGTGLQNIFIRMDEAIEKLNLDVAKFTDQAGNFSSISDFMDELGRSLGTMTSFERVIALQDAFGQRAARSAAILLQQRTALRGIAAELETTSGQAAKMQAIIENTTGSKLKIAVNNIKNFSQTVGQELVGAFQVVAGWIAKSFGFLTQWANGSGVAAAATVALTGAIVAFYGALTIMNAILRISGAATVAFHTALKAVLLTLTKAAAIAAVAFAGLSLLAKLFSGGKEIKAGFPEQMANRNFENIEKSIGRITSTAKQAQKAIDDMARAGLKFPEGHLSRMGFTDEEIERLRNGEAAIEVMGGRMKEAFSGFTQALGGTKDFGDQIGEQAVTAMRSLETLGVKGTDAAAGLAKALEMITNVPLGEGAEKWKEVLGRTLDTERAFVAEVERVVGRSVGSGSQAFAAIRERMKTAGPLGGAGVSKMSAENLVEGIKGIDEAAGKTAEVYISALKRSLEVMRDPDVQRALRDANESLFRAMTETIKTFDGKLPVPNGVYELDDGEFDRIGKTFMDKLGNAFVNSAENDFSGAELAAKILDAMRASLFEQVQSMNLGEFGARFGEALATDTAAQEAVSQFTRFAAQVEKDQQQMAKGFGSADLPKFVQNLENALAPAEKARDLFAELAKGADALAKDLPAALVGSPIETTIKGWQESATKGLAEWGQTVDETKAKIQDLRNLMAAAGDTPFTTESLKGASGAVASALEASLLTGSMDAFKKSLFESSMKALQDGIIEGVKQGMAVASTLTQLFDTEGISKKIASATASFLKGGDKETFRAEVAGILDPLRESFPKAMEVLGPLQEELSRIFQMAGGDMFGSMFSDARRAAIEEMTSALREQEAAIGSLQAALFQATETEREFIQAQIAFQRGSGVVLGTQISGLDAAARIDLLQNLISEASLRGLENRVRAFTEILAKEYEAVEKRKNLAASGDALLSGEEMRKVADEAGKVAEALNQPVGLRGDVATISRDLQTAKSAAEGLRDALASIGIGGGSLLPSQITVSGSGAAQPMTVNFGNTQVVIEAGSAVTDADLDRLRRQLDAEWETKREALIQTIRLGAPR